MNNKIYFSFIFLLIGTLIVTGCTSTTHSSSNSAPISPTCIGDCQIGQSATDGYYNYQKFTLNRVVRLHQPYIDQDPDPGFEWHNWDYLILNVTIESIRPEKSTNVGTIIVNDANGEDITCDFNIRHELTTIYWGDEIPPHQSVTGSISCYLQPNAKTPYKVEYRFLGWSKEQYAHYTINSYENSDYSSIEKNPKLGMPWGVKINH